MYVCGSVCDVRLTVAVVTDTATSTLPRANVFRAWLEKVHRTTERHSDKHHIEMDMSILLLLHHRANGVVCN